MCCHPEYSSVWASLLRCLLKGHLKRDFLDIYLTTFCGVGNLGNTSAVRFIFFFFNFPNVMWTSEIQRKVGKMSFVAELLVCELVA